MYYEKKLKRHVATRLDATNIYNTTILTLNTTTEVIIYNIYKEVTGLFTDKVGNPLFHLIVHS